MNALLLCLTLCTFFTNSLLFASQDKKPSVKQASKTTYCEDDDYDIVKKEAPAPAWSRMISAFQDSNFMAQFSSSLDYALWAFEQGKLPTHLERLAKNDSTAPGSFITQALQEAVDQRDPKKVTTMVAIVQNQTLQLADKVPQANQRSAFEFLQQHDLQVQQCLTKFPRRLQIGDGKLTPRSKSQKDTLRHMLQQRHSNISDEELTKKVNLMFGQLTTRESQQ